MIDTFSPNIVTNSKICGARYLVILPRSVALRLDFVHGQGVPIFNLALFRSL